MWEWMPILRPEDRPAIQRILSWRLSQTRRIYRLLEGPRWVEYPAESGSPPILGWEADVEEIR